MPITEFNSDLNIIAKLDDEPNDVGGLTSAELKAKFDEAGNTIQDYINDTLIPGVKAENIPFTASDAVPADTVQGAIEDVQEQIAQVVMGQIPDGSITPDKLTGSARWYYRRFSAADWVSQGDDDGYLFTVAPEVHKLTASYPAAVFTLHMLVGKTAEDFTADTIAAGRTAFINALKAANTANASAPDTYPTAEDGHIILTWHQLQYYILSGQLVDASTAQSQAAQMGYDWQSTVTTPPEGTVHTLDELLTAGYTPMLGGSQAAFDALFTVDTALGLGFRRKRDTDQPGASHTYDLFGRMTGNTWGCIETQVALDEQTKVLTLTSQEAYDGEILVMG